jgi:hypothetical protein
MISYIATFLITSLGANFLFLVFAGAAAGNANYGTSGNQLLVLGAIDLVCIVSLLSVGITLYKRGRKNWASVVGIVPIFLLPGFIIWLWSLIFPVHL